MLTSKSTWFILALLIFTFASVQIRGNTQADTLVANAAQIDDVETVRRLLGQALDVNSAQGDGMTALHWAALRGNLELTQLLLYAGANVHATTRLGNYSPLFLASKHGHSDVVSVLLVSGADAALTSAGGVSPLMMAASSGNPRAVNLLIEAGADVNATEEGRGQTSLIFAAAFNRPETIKALLIHGANIEQASKLLKPMPSRETSSNQQQGRAGKTRNPENSKALKTNDEKAVATDRPKEAEKTPRFLTKKGGNPKGQLTPLMYAARDGNDLAVQALVEAGANLDAVSADGSTALLLSSINGKFDIAKYLVEKGADVRIASIDGATPLFGVVNIQWAHLTFHPQPTTKFEETHYLDLMKIMLSKGADPNARLKKDLWYIAPGGAQRQRINASAITPFWKAAAVGDVEGMRLLVDYEADPHIANITGVTPLLSAAGAGHHGTDEIITPYGRLPAVKYLIEQLKADINASDHELPPDPNTDPNRPRRQTGGFTALHNAAARGDNEMILYLVSKGARLDAVSNNGTTITDMANGYRQRVQPYPETVALLDMLGARNSHKCVSC